MPIRILAANVVARIAAGEVVARPASVVKELVENSLDASASEITIEVEGSGISLIRVADDGIGIPAGELPLAFARHATSKISSLEDLEKMSSLGFRGEALPSIASVAEVEIISRTAGNGAGHFLALDDGVTIGEGSRGHPKGTTVTVKNLFRKVPARLKFLKSPATESSHIVNVVSQYALGYPEVKFVLTLNGKTVLRTPGSGRLIDVITGLYGLEIARNMLPLSDSSGSVRLSGMVGKPELSRASWEYVSFFANRRSVSNRMLARALEEAYHGLLMTGRHPVAVVNIFLPPSEVDVNIHPAKTEIKFQNERLIFTALERAVRQTLVQLTTVPEIQKPRLTPVSKVAEPSISYVAHRAPVREEQELWALDKSIAGSAVVSPTPGAVLPILRVLGQILGSYIVAEGPEGLYLIDQHAAHERILFEKLKEENLKHKIETQGLLQPQPFEVSPTQASILKSQLGNLADFGFSLELFGSRTYLVRSVPAVLYGKDWVEVLREVLDTLSQEDESDFREKIAISIACHGAVWAGQVLSGREMEELIRELEKAALPNTCPHGRPTIIHISQSELEKEFNRT